MSLEGNKALVHRYYDQIMSGENMAAASELMTPDCISSLPTLPEPVKGPEGWTRIITLLRNAFPDLRFTIDDEVAEEDTVVAHWTARGTHKGNLGPTPPTGKQVVFQGIGWNRVADGKLVENLVNEDSLGLLQQIGALPASQQQGTSVEENKAIAHRLFDEVWNKGNDSVIDQYIATDFIQHFPGMESGREGFRKSVAQFRNAFSDMNLTIEDEFGEGNKVVHRWTWHLTHKGEFLGVPPTGKRVAFTGMTMVRLAGGQVVEHWANLDMLGLLQELQPSPASR